MRQRISGIALDQMVSHTVSCGWIERKYRYGGRGEKRRKGEKERETV